MAMRKEYRAMEMACTVEQFIELYLDLNHVPMIHRGLNSWADVRNAEFTFTEAGSVQIAPFRVCPKHDAYLGYVQAWWAAHGGDNPPFGAVWVLDYPNSMIEIYPGLIVISKVTPTPNGCLNTLEFIQTDNDKVFEYAIDAYLESAYEDEILVTNIALDAGAGRGTFHPLLPSGVQHYRSYRALNNSN